MDLALAAHPLFLILCALAAGAFAWISYGRSTPAVTGGRRGLLAGLRFAALFLVLFLLFEPVWRRVTQTGEPPLLAVLVDDSESLTLGTTGPSPADRVRRALGTLPADDALRYYTFSGDARPAGRGFGADSLRFGGERTDIAAALGRVEADFAGRNLRGVVLLSDGRVTDGRNPSYVAERFPVPIFAGVAGDSLSSRDVQLQRVSTNEIAYAGSPLPFQIGVRASGYAGQRVPVVVSEGGRTVGQASAVLSGDGAESVVDLTVTPSGPGLRRFTVTAGPLAGEATTRNNRRTVDVRVLSDRRRVLVLAAAPGPDLTALRGLLEADASFDVTVRTQRAPGAFYEGPFPVPLNRFDLAVLVGYPGPAASANDLGQLADAARRGLAVVFVLGQQTDLRRLAALADVLPALPDPVRPGFVEVRAAPTPAGEAHPVLDGLGVAPSRLAALPPLAYNPSRWVLQPGARTLVAVRRGGTTLDAPLVAVRQSGAVRSTAVLGAGLWRWRTLPDDLGDLRPVLGSVLDRSVRWTTAARDRRPVRVRPDRALFGERERVSFTGGVYGEDLQPIEDAVVRLTVRAPGGRAERVAMRSLGNGRYVADLGPRPPGTYSFTAEAERRGATVGSDRGVFGVGRLAVEFREPGADLGLMRQIGVRSGGALVGLDTLGAFVAGLRQSGLLDDRPLVREDETPLLGVPWLLGLALALLTAEWVLRKRTGMV